MINKSFLSTISVLYVEDEELAREKLAKLLTKFFKKVDTAKNGKDGLEKFNESINTNNPYDLVISDINMPIMNGLEMLEKIRETNPELPFIFTTAKSESENLLKAIELNVNHYLMKPIDLQDLVLKSQIVCEKDYLKKELVEKQKEMENFLSAINHVAGVYIFNDEGVITYVNESFCEATGFTKDEITNKKLEDIFHPEVSKSVTSSIWEKTKENETLETIIRYNNKSEDALYFTAAIFKISGQSDKTSEYITIGFESTEDVVQKKEFNKKVMKSFQEFNKKEAKSKKTIEEYKTKLIQFQNALVKLQKDLQNEKEKNVQKESQLAHYDSTVLSTSSKKHDILEQKQKELQTYLKQNAILKAKNEEMETKLKDIEEQLRKKDAHLESYKERYEQKLLEIKQLKG